MIKSALVLTQINTKSECSLSVNVRIVTQERTSLGEKTIVGLHVIEDALKVYDSVSNKVEKIPVTQDLKKSVRSAY